MKVDSKLAKKIETADFIVTAECAPGATAAGATPKQRSRLWAANQGP